MLDSLYAIVAFVLLMTPAVYVGIELDGWAEVAAQVAWVLVFFPVAERMHRWLPPW